MLNTPITSGIPAIDTVCGDLLVGDNVVWRCASQELYKEVCSAMLTVGRQQQWPLIYFRFANHAPVTGAADVQIFQTEPELGFEHFISEIHRVIADTGTGGVYIFDSLSDLHDMYFSDRMIGCFFELTCPYLRQMETIAYFRLDPSAHSRHAIDPIRRTTQVWLDAYAIDGKRFLQPVKTWDDQAGDHSPLYQWWTGNTPHGHNSAVEVHDSSAESMVRQSEGWNKMPSTSTRQIDMWDTVLMRFADLESIKGRRAEIMAEKERLRTIAERMLLSTDTRILNLIRRFIEPQHIIAVWKRMVGTGQIGGKAVGMLLAEAIIRNTQPEIHAQLEAHDTFYIGSDVFYTYLVENNCWWERRQLHAEPEDSHTGNLVAHRMRNGNFPSRTLQAFRDVLEYFGNAPIIVRSSSLLEDNFGNAFAGKYESFFLANQGSAGDRLGKFVDAVRKIYAGTVHTDALAYRRERGVIDKDEQMALLVQRVSGRRRGSYFFPDISGVGLSYNPYVWLPNMDPHAGMSRLVIGLGTRAVDRTQEDSARIVAHGLPDRRPDESRQQHLDAIDLQKGELCEVPLRDPDILKIPEILVEHDWRRERAAREMGLKSAARIGVEQALGETDIARLLELIGRSLEDEYGTPVEFEYTAQWDRDNERWQINIVQCRPFQITTGHSTGVPDGLLESIPEPQQLIRCPGPIIGHGRYQRLDAIVWIDPHSYSALEDSKRYAEADRLEECIQQFRSQGKQIFLFGPGRWGTSTPSMGVPARFGQIRGISILGELDWMHAALSPDLSLGTHFFHDLVEEDVLYIALRRDNSRIRWDVLNSAMESLKDTEHAGSVRWYTPPDGEVLWLAADPARHDFMVYRVLQDAREKDYTRP
ncbi:MAG: PEP/pyruvate-binding domain-containing protein [Spirochaeta sp.]